MEPSNISKQSQQTIQNIETEQFHFVIKLKEKKTKKHMQQKNTIIARVVIQTKIQNEHSKQNKPN